MTSAFSPVFNIDTVVCGSTIQWLPFNQNMQPQMNFPITDLIVNGLQVYKQEQLQVTSLYDGGFGDNSTSTVSFLLSEFPFGQVSMLGIANQDQVHPIYVFYAPFDTPEQGSYMTIPPGGYMLQSVTGHTSTETAMNIFTSATGQSSTVTVFVAGA